MFHSRRKIGLALGSGGARGLAHVGVLQCLVNHKIPIDYIAGTSAGALIGGMYAVHQDISRVRKVWDDFGYKDFFSLLTDFGTRKGILKGNKAEEFINSIINGPVNIEDLQVPFQAVATDIFTAEVFRFSRGDLAKSIRASGSLPFVVEPCDYEGKLLVDGGASEPVPVNTVKKMGADIVIAVNLDSSFFPEHGKEMSRGKVNVVNVLQTTVHLFRYHLAECNVKEASIVIKPQLQDMHLIQFVNGDSIIEEGIRRTEAVIGDIKALL